MRPFDRGTRSGIGDRFANPLDVAEHGPARQHRGVVIGLPIALARLVLVDVLEDGQQKPRSNGFVVGG